MCVLVGGFAKVWIYRYSGTSVLKLNLFQKRLGKPFVQKPNLLCRLRVT